MRYSDLGTIEIFLTKPAAQIVNPNGATMLGFNQIQLLSAWIPFKLSNLASKYDLKIRSIGLSLKLPS